MSTFPLGKDSVQRQRTRRAESSHAVQWLRCGQGHGNLLGWCTQMEHGPGCLQGVLRRASREEEQELDSVYGVHSLDRAVV